MASDPDSCLPGPLKDFVFDLHDSARRSQIASEQATLYNGTFRDLSSKYFATSAWPSPQSVSSECGGDALFLALYRELTHRHLHSVTRPTVRDRIDGWHVYRELFDLLLSEAPSEEEETTGDAVDKSRRVGGGGGASNLFILPDWAFDILHEFVYQFQGFCQYRTSIFANAAKHAKPHSSGDDGAAPEGGAGAGGKTAPQHILDALSTLSSNRDAWAVETVLFYLHRLVAVGTVPSCKTPAYQYLGLFASVALSRLECLLGDYHASLAALTPVYGGRIYVTTIAGEEGGTIVTSAEDVVNGVFSARLSLAYHAGVSYLMLRRYKDALRILGDICSYMQRGFKTGQLRKLPGSDQFNKQYDRMIALLAILTHICPLGGLVDDSIVRTVRDKHGAQLSKIEAGEEGYEELFIFACPKFVSPAVPEYSQATSAGGGENATSGQDAYKLQVRHFMNEMSTQQSLRKLRSYMKLYTSISVGKLAAFNDMAEEEFIPLLLCYKHKMRQLEAKGGNVGDDENVEEGAASLATATTPPPLGGTVGTALDIHYYIANDMVHVDEAEKPRRFENYFMKQIAQNEEIMKDVQAINVDF